MKHQRTRNSEYYGMPEVFDNLFDMSKRGKVFKDLMSLIASRRNILLAYRNIKSNSGSVCSGIDGLDIEYIKRFPAEKLVKYIQNRFMLYKPQTVRRCIIPKPGSGKRPLGIPTIFDRFAQQCILQVLEPICEAKFQEYSYGFRINRSAEHAIAQCYNAIQNEKLMYAVDVDLKSFFDNVSHSKLIRQLWRLGIRDKKLLSIIKAILKAPVLLPNGEVIHPSKGTPQGGILSPLLANVVLNDLDLMFAQHISTHDTVECHEETNDSSACRKFHEMVSKGICYIRYADDFKVLCRSRSEAESIYKAVTTWLVKVLKLEVNIQKSKITNLKDNYSEFLGFKIKAVKKSDAYVIESSVSDKALCNITSKLIEQIHNIHRSKDSEQANQINIFNSMVRGIHGYFDIATDIQSNCMSIQVQIDNLMNKYFTGLRCNGEISNASIAKAYGESSMLRFFKGIPICPIGYISYRAPIRHDSDACPYTPQGRKSFHKCLRFSENTLKVLHDLAEARIPNASTEYYDNRLAIYAMQHGKCYVTKQFLSTDEVYFHHIIPINKGGTDRFNNLVLVSREVYDLLHAESEDEISESLPKLIQNKSQLKRFNKLRTAMGYPVE